MLEEKKGRIVNLVRCCVHDGPGIRTTVFLKGCPLRCVWCHNPETQNRECEICFHKDKCAQCGRCQKICRKHCHSFIENSHVFQHDNCIACKECVSVCPTGALEIVGKEVTALELLEELEKDRIFYEQSGGGITISGGEPFFQPEFTYEVLKQCRERGIHTAVETCGFVNPDIYLECLEYCELVLFDLKESDEERHMQYTGVPLKPILENLALTEKKGVPFIVRLPVIPGFNDREEHFRKVKEITEPLKNCLFMEVMPYHKLGVYKYETLGRHYEYGEIAEPNETVIQQWRDLLSKDQISPTF